MLALALETSGRPGGIALGWRDASGALVVRAFDLDAARPHASDLLPLAADALEVLGRRPSELTEVLVGIGPGSYTGLRVAVATALGLAVGVPAPALFGVPSPEALFHASLAEGETGVWIQDARSGGWYFASGRRTRAGLEVLAAPELLDADELLARLDEVAPDVRRFSDALSLAALTKLTAAGASAAATFEQAAASAAAVLELGLERLASAGPVEPGQLAPLYLRPFAAKIRKR